MNRIAKFLLSLAVLLPALWGASAAAEAKITYTPEKPKAGEYVDITVQPDREGAIGVRYELSTSDGVVCKNKEASVHYTASFRPREEAEYTLTAVIVYGKKDTESVSVTIPVSGVAPVQEGAGVVYSQKDGWWHKTVYSKKPYETLEKGGCAIFALSHILQRLGYSGEEVLPAALASRNARFYIANRGTDNGGLINQAADDYSFITEEDLITTEHEAVDCLRRGDLFSFGIALGHIAMADGVSDDGSKIHVVDSAPGATFERKNRFKTKGHIFYQLEDGSFEEAVTIDQLPGIRWFFETEEYGGMAYWLDINYALHYNKHAGMRLVRRPWLQANILSGPQAVTLEYSGAFISKVNTGEESVRVPTKDLSWTTEGAESPRIAVVSNKKGANLVDGNGKNLERYSRKLSPGTMLTVLSVEDDLCYVFWKDTFCYILRKNVDLLTVQETVPATGTVSGSPKVTVRNAPGKKGAVVAELNSTTPVVIVEAGKDFTLVEGKGYRGWIPNRFLTPDTAE